MEEFSVHSWLEESRYESTQLGVCPMSKEIIDATFQEASVNSPFVPMFIATPRQVDADRGYTGWSQSELIELLEASATAAEYDGPYVVARDHGGPYQSMRDRDDSEVPVDDAMSYAKELFLDDLRAGFDILHVDATEDPTVDGILDLGEIARRTTELIVYLEEKRETEGFAEVYYEVGTEEITGGMTNADDFERFIELLEGNLREARFGNTMERVLFVVGQVGTTMKIGMENSFERSKTRELTTIVDTHGLYLKVHYTDWLDESDLSTFPELGVGAANVGPEFAAAVVHGLETLEQRERDAVGNETNDASNFMGVLEDAAVEDAPWRKFAPDHLDDEELEGFARENRRNIAVCVGRYVLNRPDVVEARQTMYENLRRNRSAVDPDQLIVDSVRESIHRYVQAFNEQ